MTRTITLIAIAAAAALVFAAPGALAAAPVQEVIQIDDTFTHSNCGFPVEEHVQATLRSTSWYDESGARTREIVTASRSTITWTNLDTGASVTTASPYVVHKTDNPDGTTTIAFTGLVLALNDGGQVYVASGRAVLLFAPDHVEPVSNAGPGTDLCEALAATIG